MWSAPDRMVHYTASWHVFFILLCLHLWLCPHLHLATSQQQSESNLSLSSEAWLDSKLVSYKIQSYAWNLLLIHYRTHNKLCIILAQIDIPIACASLEEVGSLKCPTNFRVSMHVYSGDFDVCHNLTWFSEKQTSFNPWEELILM